jgi:hypothetical protein
MPSAKRRGTGFKYSIIDRGRPVVFGCSRNQRLLNVIDADKSYRFDGSRLCHNSYGVLEINPDGTINRQPSQGRLWLWSREWLKNILACA